jgi:hypothetical protein
MSEACSSAIGSATRTVPIFLGAAKEALKELSEPWPTDSLVRDAIKRAAKKVLVPLNGRLIALSYSRASDIWYGKARRIEEFERDAISAAIDKHRREAARNELHTLKTRIALLEARLAQADSEYHREAVDVLGQMARAGR